LQSGYLCGGSISISMTTEQQIVLIKNLIKPLIVKGTMSFKVYEFFGAIVASINCPNHSVIIECRAYEKEVEVLHQNVVIESFTAEFVDFKDSKGVFHPCQIDQCTERVFWQILIQAI
jgi:hypothetical protein